MQEAKAMPVGTVRTWSNGTFIKTKDGWEPHKEGGGSSPAPEIAPTPEPVAEPKPYTIGSSLRVSQTFDAAAASNAFVKMLTSKSEEDQKVAREYLNKLCSDFGMLDRNVSKEGRYKLKVSRKEDLPPNVSGIHHWSGEIEVQNVAMLQSVAYLRGVAHATANGIHTLIHEAVHGHSPVRQENWCGNYRVLEEATTEMAARKVMRDSLGIPWKKFSPHISDETGMYDRGLGSYEDFCTLMRQGVEMGLYHSGIREIGSDDPYAYQDLIGAASIEMRRRPPPFDNSMDEFLERFAASVPVEVKKGYRNPDGSREKVAKKIVESMRVILDVESQREKVTRWKALILTAADEGTKNFLEAMLEEQMKQYTKAQERWTKYQRSGRVTESRLAVLLQGLEEALNVQDKKENEGMLPRNDIALAIAYARVLSAEGRLTGDALRDLALLQDNSEQGIKLLAEAVRSYGLTVVA
jgi:hypothetical protein